ncbi:MAG TPA: biliverdin-producing heme oxygenase [Candidatus Janibacter merdipullorum]|nr:biliverdin-producing heme oxygenase [Candidatus Janibacter merdipullorum]
MTTLSPDTALSTLVREGSRAEHSDAEGSTFMTELLAGRLDGAGYAHYLAVLRPVYAALEGGWPEARRRPGRRGFRRPGPRAAGGPRRRSRPLDPGGGARRLKPGGRCLRRPDRGDPRGPEALRGAPLHALPRRPVRWAGDRAGPRPRLRARAARGRALLRLRGHPQAEALQGRLPRPARRAPAGRGRQGRGARRGQGGLRPQRRPLRRALALIVHPYCSSTSGSAGGPGISSARR